MKNDNDKCEAKYEIGGKKTSYSAMLKVFSAGNYEFLRHSCATLKTTLDMCIEYVFNQRPFTSSFKPESVRFGHLCKAHYRNKMISLPDPDMV